VAVEAQIVAQCCRAAAGGTAIGAEAGDGRGRWVDDAHIDVVQQRDAIHEWLIVGAVRGDETEDELVGVAG
jgi:hypothetical protein